MKLIDTHAHLYATEFTEDLEDVIERAKQNNIYKVLLPNIDEKSIEPLKSLIQKDSDFFVPMMGLHPTSVKSNYKKILLSIKNELQTGKYIAVGEIGIDLYWDKTFIKEQTVAFHTQIEYALEYNLPIAVHARDSFSEILEILETYKNTSLQGVLHSFTGTTEEAKQAIDLGFYIGVGGITTFKNSGLGRIIANQPLNKLILETDSPYLAPTPLRGKRNESAFLIHIAHNLAKLKNTTIEEISNATTQNAKNLFKL